MEGILAGAAIIAVVGALDDRFDLPPGVKLAGQVVAATIPVAPASRSRTSRSRSSARSTSAGRRAADRRRPRADHERRQLLRRHRRPRRGRLRDQRVWPSRSSPSTSTAGRRRLAADHRRRRRRLPRHNLPPRACTWGTPARTCWGCCWAAIAVEGAVKTQAVLALLFPLVVLAVPFLDTTFVVLKRMKYRRPVYGADANHFHHRFSRIGFSAKRRTVLYLYGWTACLAAFAVALRFVPYSDRGDLDLGWVGGHGRDRSRRPGRQRLRRLRPRDPQVQAAGRRPPAPRAPRHHRGRDRRRRRAAAGDGRVRGGRAGARVQRRQSSDTPPNRADGADTVRRDPFPTRKEGPIR